MPTGDKAGGAALSADSYDASASLSCFSAFCNRVIRRLISLATANAPDKLVSPRPSEGVLLDRFFLLNVICYEMDFA